ncbi:MAG: SGNH/GDSL hydrolase family protein [Acutalibacteraceae bacterium]|nr:SGNH/GDSL hydrolase family protein [Acutalibacteraceae bacterium]
MNIQEFIAKENEKPLDRIVSDGGFTSIFRTIACIGDSLASGEFESIKADGSHGWHDMYEYSWGQYIGRMCGSTVHSLSRGGMTAKVYCESFADSNGFWNPKYASQCYIIALGVNDILNVKQELGSVKDVDFSDYKNNKENFAGYYAQIIQRLKQIQPRAKFFLMTMAKDGENDSRLEEKQAHSALLYDFADKFDNTYVIDLLKYAPTYDEKFKENFYLCGHMNPMGYDLTAKMVASYIDYIIRHNPQDFKEVGFIGTDLHG